MNTPAPEPTGISKHALNTVVTLEAALQKKKKEKKEKGRRKTKRFASALFAGVRFVTRARAFNGSTRIIQRSLKRGMSKPCRATFVLKGERALPILM